MKNGLIYMEWEVNNLIFLIMKRKFSLDFLNKSFNKLKRINKKPPWRESLALYREVLKFTKEFNWCDEFG